MKFNNEIFIVSNPKIECLICKKSVSLQSFYQKPSHYWWCIVKRFIIWLAKDFEK